MSNNSEVIFNNTEDVIESSSLATGVLIFLLVLWTTVGYLIAKRCKFLGEGSAASLLGLGAGVIIVIAHNRIQHNVVKELLVFDSAQFFTYLLPPIIFYAGLSVQKKQFFRNFFSITGLGVLGTFLSFTFLSLIMIAFSKLSNLITEQDCLALGAIFAATDSVATLQILEQDRMPLLYSLVFGEGVMNDATSVVLLKTVQFLGERDDSITGVQVGSIISKFLYLFVLSLLLGVFCGLLTSYLIKKMTSLGTQQEISLVALMAYFSYLSGEVLGLSGILTIFFCAIIISQYALKNMSLLGRGCAIQVFKCGSYLAEGVIFIYVGMDSLDVRKWQAAEEGTSFWLFIVLIFVLSVTRILFVVPVSAFHNYFSKQKLAVKDVIIIWWAGMMRGAVSVALVYYYFDPQGVSRSPHKSTLIVATLLVVLFSTLILGAITKPLLEHLLLNYSEEPFLKHASFTLPFITSRPSPSSSPSLTQISQIKAYPNQQHYNQEPTDPTLDVENELEEYQQHDEQSSLIQTPHQHNRQEISDASVIDVSNNLNESDLGNRTERRTTLTDPNTLGGKLILLWEQFDEIIMQPIFGSIENDDMETQQRGLVSSRSVLSLSPAMQIKSSEVRFNSQVAEVELGER
eukprot:TRINITY_DN7920_c0_g1_i1.p1 TRINITY_DN7920_c0_g1~~TRINITY_DN7920_c0_g1_i1.p1  ORF type:complete len:629 (-),score=86.62 TRINITY_DN7920_c0_g1_i1:1644-3530(-)